MVAKIKQVLRTSSHAGHAAQEAASGHLTASELADRLQSLLGGNHV